MDGLCAAFAQLAANCEGGTMMQDLDTGEIAVNNQPAFGGSTTGRVAGAGRGGKGRGRLPPPQTGGARPGWAAGPSWNKPYEKQFDPSSTSLTAALNTIGAVYTPVPEQCGCEPPTRENIYLGMVQTAKERNRWDEGSLDEVRKRVADMAKLGTEDNQMCVPWRVSPRHTRHLPTTTVEGQQYDADFVLIAPSPQKFYEGETIVFTPKVAVQPNACLLSVLTTLECKFKACWEMAHLVSLSGKDKAERLPYSAKLLACLAKARTTPDEVPWAIIRPFARPPNTIAPPVEVSILDLSLGPGLPGGPGQPGIQDAVKVALDDVLRTSDETEDTTVDLGIAASFPPPSAGPSPLPPPMSTDTPPPLIDPTAQEPAIPGSSMVQ